MSVSTVEHCEMPGLLPLNAAIRRIVEQVDAVLDTEYVSLYAANNRVIAHDVVSTINVPPADNSAMDGYALRAADLNTHATLTQVGTALAGLPFVGELQTGQCVRIMTGAIIPHGADSVEMQENTEVRDQQVRFLQNIDVGQNIRRSGSDIANQQLVIQAGTRLHGAHLALLASIGQAQVLLRRKLRVALLATGDELKPPGMPLTPGAIFETNSYALHALLQDLNVEVLNYGIVGDDKDSLRQAFNTADQQCDLVISCGGVSVGDADFVKDILAELGNINFWKVAIKPGKPFAFGRLRQAWFCGLPGNPVSSFVTFEQLVTPLIKVLSGQKDSAAMPRYYAAKAATTIRKRPGRMDFQRAWSQYDELGTLRVTPVGSQSSGVMSSLTNANCYVVLEQEQGDVEANSMVNILPFKHN
ncbi:MAG: molybdopterin molybdotransferase MoeA [Paraglaciecola sp.]|nr:molybdopterin molybdotransferase MoeA [Paraglaciecola sp.]NCT48641.1 molybdopterin molybdotransferase MoeA [Paraglaciecola sp.]